MTPIEKTIRRPWMDLGPDGSQRQGMPGNTFDRITLPRVGLNRANGYTTRLYAKLPLYLARGSDAPPQQLRLTAMEIL